MLVYVHHLAQFDYADFRLLYRSHFLVLSNAAASSNPSHHESRSLVRDAPR
jgi:hypothetical protein